MKDHREQNIFITGGSRGIGAYLASYLSERGARIALTYHSHKEAGEKVLESLHGENHLLVPMNIANPPSIKKAFEEVLKVFGKLHGLVNNAGITKDQLLLLMKPDHIDKVIDTNLKGTIYSTQEAVKTMIKVREGSIVNISSVVASLGNPGQSNYVASKAGIEGFSRSIAREVASRNIRVNCVAPGFIQTDMTNTLTEKQKEAILDVVPLKRMGEPLDIASVVSFLLKKESSYITGQTLHVNGGMYMC